MPPLPALVILPGLDGGSALARAFVDHLPPTVAPIALDLPTDVPCLLDWVGGLLPRDRPFFLLGQSFTTPLALELARRHAVRGLILVTPLMFRRPRRGLTTTLRVPPKFLLRLPPPRFAVRWLLLGRDAPPDLLDAFDAAVRAIPGRVLADRLRELGGLFAGKAAPVPPCPTLCLHALQDRLLVGPHPAMSEGPTRHVALPGPHLLLARRPAEVASEVEAFMRRCCD